MESKVAPLPLSQACHFVRNGLDGNGAGGTPATSPWLELSVIWQRHQVLTRVVRNDGSQVVGVALSLPGISSNITQPRPLHPALLFQLLPFDSAQWPIRSSGCFLVMELKVAEDQIGWQLLPTHTPGILPFRGRSTLGGTCCGRSTRSGKERIGATSPDERGSQLLA